MRKGRLVALSVSAAAVAFASLVYEFLLAQSLAAVFGGSVLRYNLTVGLFVAALGLGALMLAHSPPEKAAGRLLATELLLTALGLAGPVTVLACDWLARQPALASMAGGIQILAYAPVVAVGIVSGLELPLLMQLGDRERVHGGITVLGVDYLGMCLGTIVFPVVVMPRFGLFAGSYATALLNLVVAALLFLTYRRELGSWRWPTTLAAAALLLAFLGIYGDQAQSFVVAHLYVGVEG